MPDSAALPGEPGFTMEGTRGAAIASESAGARFICRLAQSIALRFIVLAGTAALAFTLASAWDARLPIGSTARILLQSWWPVGVVIAQLIAAHACGLYAPVFHLTFRRLLGRVALTAVAPALTVVLLRGLQVGTSASAGLAARHAATGFALLSIVFLILQRLERVRRERVLLLGPWREKENFVLALKTLPSRSEPIFVDDARREFGEGGLPDPGQLLRETRPDRVYVVRPSFQEDDVLRLVEAAPEGVSINVVPSTWDSLISRLALGPILGDLRIFEVRSPLADPVTAALKRAFDLVAALVLLGALAPLLAFLAAWIRLDSPGPALYVQRRIGRGGRTFRILKLRTMRPDAEAESGAVLAAKDDARVTRAGRWIRALRLDELPQLWNVLRGDMSLVGPRPERPELAETHRASLPGYDLRHRARPGITGLAQVYGRYHSHAREKLRFDLAYVYNYSFGLDLVLLVKSVWIALTRRGN